MNADGMAVVATWQFTLDGTSTPDPITVPTPFTGFRCRRITVRQIFEETQTYYKIYAPTTNDDPHTHYPAEAHVFNAPPELRWFKPGDVPGYGETTNSSGSATGSATFSAVAEG